MKIRKTTITLTVLGPEDLCLDSYSLAELARELDDGECVGQHQIAAEEIIEGADNIIAVSGSVGHDGSLFLMGEDDESLEDEEV